MEIKKKVTFICTRLGTLCCFACGTRKIGAPVSGGVSDLVKVTFREVVEDGVTLAMSSVARNFPRALRLYIRHSWEVRHVLP
jgi:hypothetical protein